jgi:hypothetical protein
LDFGFLLAAGKDDSMDTTSRIFFIIVFFGAIWLLLDQFYGDKRLGRAAKNVVEMVTGGLQ